MNAEQTTIVYGAPGTGKTARLAELLGESLRSGIDPERIGFFAFTKRGSQVARQRIKETFGLGDRQVRWFRTLHSLAYLCTATLSDQIVTTKSMVEFALSQGYPAHIVADIAMKRVRMDADLERPIWTADASTKNPFLQIMTVINNSRVKGTTLDFERCELIRRDFDAEMMYRLNSAYRQWKADNYMFDYTDLLMEACKAPLPELDVIFIDEAQDLSPLQWDLVSALAPSAQRVYLAGDDDQAIYRWAGADVDKFIHAEGTREILPQSYRVSRNIQKAAQHIIDHVSDRQEKNWKPLADGGIVRKAPAPEELDMSQGEWLVLARNQYMLTPYAQLCKRKQWDFSTGIRYGKEETSRIRLSTIHQAKGAEADHVVVLPDMAEKSYKAMVKNTRGMDDECRVFYVALTRAKKELVLMAPVRKRVFPYLKEYMESI